MLPYHFAQFVFFVSTCILFTGIHSQDCGQSSVVIDQDAPVKSYVNATEGAWPWMVAITEYGKGGNDVFLCSGFLIDRKHVISEAHCFQKKEEVIYFARIGAVNHNKGEIYPICNIVIHEGYKRGRYHDDIAILTLIKDVDLPNFNPICLPDEELENRKLKGLTATAVTWSDETYGVQPSAILKQLNKMPVVSIPICDSVYRDNLPSFSRDFPQGITGEYICAGFPEGFKDACASSSGGPLMLQDRNRWFAVGIKSFGFNCASPSIPDGYTRISTYLEWITENTMDCAHNSNGNETTQNSNDNETISNDIL